MLDEASPWTIVGIDCASQDANIGLARGTLSSAGLSLEQPSRRATDDLKGGKRDGRVGS